MIYNIQVDREDLSNIIAGLKSLIVSYSGVLKKKGLTDAEIVKILNESTDALDILKLINKLEEVK